MIDNLKISMYLAASLDGRIARPDGDIGWLGDTGEELQDFGYQEFFAGVDCLVMGGKTYRQIRASHAWFYAGKPTWVYSRSPFAADIADVFHADLPPAALVEQLGNEGKRHLWVLGGGEIHSLFLRAGLVDEMRLFIMPLALGEGIPVFAPPIPEQRWRLTGVRQWNGDVAELRYARIGKGARS